MFNKLRLQRVTRLTCDHSARSRLRTQDRNRALRFQPRHQYQTRLFYNDMAPLGSTLRIAIPGAGVAGLATALSLAQQGFQHIEVLETASDLGFVGAGIQVAPNLSRVLQNLGVWDGIKDDAVEVEETSIRGITSVDRKSVV